MSKSNDPSLIARVVQESAITIFNQVVSSIVSHDQRAEARRAIPLFIRSGMSVDDFRKLAYLNQNASVALKEIASFINDAKGTDKLDRLLNAFVEFYNLPNKLDDFKKLVHSDDFLSIINIMSESLRKLPHKVKAEESLEVRGLKTFMLVSSPALTSVLTCSMIELGKMELDLTKKRTKKDIRTALYEALREQYSSDTNLLIFDMEDDIGVQSASAQDSGERFLATTEKSDGHKSVFTISRDPSMQERVTKSFVNRLTLQDTHQSAASAAISK